MLNPMLTISWMPYTGKYGVAQIHCFAESLEHVKAIAPAARLRPAGQRAMFFQNATNTMFSDPRDLLAGRYNTLWWPAGVADWKARMTANVKALTAAGVKLEYALFDIEGGMSCWMLGQESLAAIYADPRYKKLVATGNFPADCRNMSEEQRMHFNYGCAMLNNAAINEAIIGPLHQSYPDLPWSNFEDYPLGKADAVYAMDNNSHQQYYPKSGATHYSPAFYGSIHNLRYLYPKIFTLPWACVALSCNKVRGIYRADPAAKIIPWLAPKAESNILDQAHWQELVFQMFLLCGPRSLYFNNADYSVLGNWKYDNLVAQFVAQAKGSAWKATLNTTMTDYEKSSVEMNAAKLASGRTIGRVTFRPGVNSATVKVGGKTVRVGRPSGGVGVWFSV